MEGTWGRILKMKQEKLNKIFNEYEKRLSNVLFMISIVEQNANDERKRIEQNLAYSEKLSPEMRKMFGVRFQHFSCREYFANVDKIIGSKETPLDELYKLSFRVQNKSYQWLLVEAYEDFLGLLEKCHEEIVGGKVKIKKGESKLIVLCEKLTCYVDIKIDEDRKRLEKRINIIRHLRNSIVHHNGLILPRKKSYIQKHSKKNQLKTFLGWLIATDTKNDEDIIWLMDEADSENPFVKHSRIESLFNLFHTYSQALQRGVMRTRESYIADILELIFINRNLTELTKDDYKRAASKIYTNLPCNGRGLFPDTIEKMLRGELIVSDDLVKQILTDIENDAQLFAV